MESLLIRPTGLLAMDGLVFDSDLKNPALFKRDSPAQKNRGCVQGESKNCFLKTGFFQNIDPFFCNAGSVRILSRTMIIPKLPTLASEPAFSARILREEPSVMVFSKNKKRILYSKKNPFLKKMFRRNHERKSIWKQIRVSVNCSQAPIVSPVAPRICQIQIQFQMTMKTRVGKMKKQFPKK